MCDIGITDTAAWHLLDEVWEHRDNFAYTKPTLVFGADQRPRLSYLCTNWGTILRIYMTDVSKALELVDFGTGLYELCRVDLEHGFPRHNGRTRIECDFFDMRAAHLPHLNTDITAARIVNGIEAPPALRAFIEKETDLRLGD